MAELDVGFLIDRWEPERGGAERCLAQLAEHLESRGRNVHVFAERRSPGSPGRFHHVHPSLMQGGLLPGGRALVLGEELASAARIAGCRVTIGIRHLPEVDLFWPHDGSHQGALEGIGRARGRVVKPTGRHKVFLRLERGLMQKSARRIACVSQLVFDELLRFYPGSEPRLRLVPNGIDLDRFQPSNRSTLGKQLRVRLGVPPKSPLIAFIGRDPLRKGLPQLFEALRHLRKKRWRCVVAGVHHPARWRRIARKHGLDAKRVVVESFVPAPELHAAADLVVVPTWRDACLLAVLEALATGTPVVTTRYAGAATVISEQAGTVLDDPGDSEALAAAIGSWLDRIEAREVERDALRECVAHRGLAPWLERLEELVEDLAG